ncbi:hypothetical protein MarSH_044 [Marseillevirus Shanghai 1]|nr:hypothetical protein MarSH_044 [Marseillevirus Shanghai 1]
MSEWENQTLLNFKSIENLTNPGHYKMRDFELAFLFLSGAFLWFLCSVLVLVFIAVSVERDRPQRIS